MLSLAWLPVTRLECRRMLRGLASSRVTPREVRSGAAAGGGRVSRGKLLFNVWALCNTGGGRSSRRSMGFCDEGAGLYILLEVGDRSYDGRFKEKLWKV